MTDNSPPPPPPPFTPEGFHQYFKRSLASMAPDIDLALLGETMPCVDAWRQLQAEPPSRSDAIRRLIDLGLEAARQQTDPITPTEADALR